MHVYGRIWIDRGLRSRMLVNREFFPHSEGEAKCGHRGVAATKQCADAACKHGEAKREKRAKRATIMIA